MKTQPNSVALTLRCGRALNQGVTVNQKRAAPKRAKANVGCSWALTGSEEKPPLWAKALPMDG